MRVLRRSESLEEALLRMGATVRGVNQSIMVEGNGVNTDIFREGNGVNMDGWVEGLTIRMDGWTEGVKVRLIDPLTGRQVDERKGKKRKIV